MDSNYLRYKPTGYSYRVDDNIWSGEYPVWDWESGARARQLQLFTDFGINHFVDLTESGEMPPYEPLLQAGVKHQRVPIPNGGVPNSVQSIVELFRQIEPLRNSGETKVYIHCVGGVGRTGTIIACYYIYFWGLSAEQAITQMRSRFASHGRSAWMTAPESSEQENFIQTFQDNYRQWR